MMQMDSIFYLEVISMTDKDIILITKVLIRMEVAMMTLAFTYRLQMLMISKRMKPGRSMLSIMMSCMDLKLMKMTSKVQKTLVMRMLQMMRAIGKLITMKIKSWP